MSSVTGRTDHDVELRRFEDRMLRLQARAAVGSRALGVPEWDWRLASIGRECLAARAGGSLALEARHRTAGRPPCDVYLATQVYDIGGHTALIGDMVRALDPAAHSAGPAGGRSHLVVTNLYGQNPPVGSDALLGRLGLPRGHLTILDGASRAACLERLFDTLLSLAPDRLFLFHHSHDPLAAAAAQPEIAARRFLVHHADRAPSFAMHLPDVRIIDLFPAAAAMTRLLGRRPALLPLTAEDPGPRPGGFLRRGRLVTASSGNAHKFDTPYLFSYADTVGRILKTTGGWHVHVGPLTAETRERIDRAVTRAGAPLDRFVHVSQVPSVARALWEYRCDVYVASFPIDGARTRIEVLASGTPYLRHSASLDTDGDPADAPARAADGLVWRTWEDLSGALARVSTAGALEEQSALMRAEYERTHHPGVFARTLGQIVEGGSGVEVPDAGHRLERARDSLVRSLMSAMLQETHVAESVESAHEGLAYLRDRLDAVQDQLTAARVAFEAASHEPRPQSEATTAESQRALSGRGVRARLRRWLSMP